LRVTGDPSSSISHSDSSDDDEFVPIRAFARSDAVDPLADRFRALAPSDATLRETLTSERRVFMLSASSSSARRDGKDMELSAKDAAGVTCTLSKFTPRSGQSVKDFMDRFHEWINDLNISQSSWVKYLASSQANPEAKRLVLSVPKRKGESYLEHYTRVGDKFVANYTPTAAMLRSYETLFAQFRIGHKENIDDFLDRFLAKFEQSHPD
jgi:hypothetical protein